ncbi:hypothetical protein [Methylorubrum thiocyanatum]|uniref:Uncharacterized protein n=1 Tax=Methylorubrum thiocyanatum TaxID=47958 RepID=A0AA40S862_9HYPH|nr:hypothetical protein [Methylorubrum thiocyanatum]MBA8916102.1 hypothetical protein [Methylorubrum thiocyanatum]
MKQGVTAGPAMRAVLDRLLALDQSQDLRLPPRLVAHDADAFGDPADVLRLPAGEVAQLPH